jgi:hypothetical protein
VQSALQRHREREPPHAVVLLRRFEHVAAGGLDREETRCVFDQISKTYERTARQANSLAAPLLSEMSPHQIGPLVANMA